MAAAAIDGLLTLSPRLLVVLKLLEALTDDVVIVANVIGEGKVVEVCKLLSIFVCWKKE